MHFYFVFPGLFFFLTLLSVYVCASLSSELSVFPTASLSLQTQRLLQQIPSAPPVSGVYLCVLVPVCVCVCVTHIRYHITVSLCVSTLCVCVFIGNQGNSATLQQSVTVYVYVSLLTSSVSLSAFSFTDVYILTQNLQEQCSAQLKEQVC